jgi:hypothetical protein
MAGAAPAAANRVGSQSMLMATWSLVRPGAMRAGHAITMGMRSPPSSKIAFLASERPGVGETLAAVVAGKYDDCILGQAVGVESLEHAADLRVHRLDHALIGLLCAPLGEKEERCERRRANRSGLEQS